MKNTKRKWPKIVGISVGSVIGLLALVILLLPTIISSNFAKNRIVNSLKTSLGRDVHIDDISMSWSSGFDIKNIHIKERDGLPGDTFVKTDRILCDIKVLPLLKKQIKIRNLVIDNPEIVLQRGKKGISKYEDKGKPVEVIPSPETMEEYAPEVVGKPAEKPEYTPLIILPLLSDIRIKAKINNGKFTFIDHRLNEKTIIKNFDTTLNIESIDKPIELKSVFDIEAKDKTEHADISLHVSLAEDGKINPRNANGTFNLKTGFARMIGDFDMARFSGKGGTGFDFLMNVDLKEFTEKFSGILGLPEGMQMKGVINSKITAEGRLDEVIGIDGITEIANLNISGGPFKDKTIRESKIRLFQNADIDMVSNDVTIHKISVNTSFIEVKSSGTLNRNRVIDLNTFLVVPNIKKLMDNFSGIVSLPQGLSVSGKIAGEINVNGSIDKEIKLSGKTILYGVTATGGPLKDTKISNLNLKLIHTLDYDKTEDSVNIEKMDIVSDFLDMSSKGKITSLSREQNIDYKLSLNMDLDNINTMFTEMLPVNTSMTGKGIVGLGLNGKLSTKDNFYEDVNLNGNVSIDT
ncbi:MAG: AsmA family protein, partial [Planctomycetota bacterium]